MKTTTKRAAELKSGVHLEASRYGTPTPSYFLVASWVRTAGHREINAALYRLAASIEEATPASESWVVVVDRDSVAVRLELGRADHAEAARGMAILSTVERA